MKPAERLDALVWSLVYGGLVAASVGFALQRTGAVYGWFVVAAGALALVAGIVLLVVRSRLRER